MNAYLLAFMMCLPGGPDAECRYHAFELPSLRHCAAMKRLVLAEARDEGFTATAVCYPIMQEISQ